MSCSSSLCPVGILVLQRQESSCCQMPEPRLLLSYESLASGLCGRAGSWPGLCRAQPVPGAVPAPPNPSAQREQVDGGAAPRVWLLGSTKPRQVQVFLCLRQDLEGSIAKVQLFLPVCDTAMKSQPMISAGSVSSGISRFVSTVCETPSEPSQWQVLSAPSFTSLHLNSASAPPFSSH